MTANQVIEGNRNMGRHRLSGFVAPDQAWLTPSFFIFVPVVASFAAWFVVVALRGVGYASAASEELTGFSRAATTGIGGILLLVTWYGAVAAMATLGWRLAASRQPREETVRRTGTEAFERRYFSLILITAAIGVAYAYFKIASAHSIVGLLTTQTANEFSSALSSFAGPQTLRYASILAAPIGVYLWRENVIRWPGMVAGVVVLILNAAITSRLSLLMAVFVYIVLWAKSEGMRVRRRGIQPRQWTAAIVLISVLFILLTGMNYVRNANFFRDHGVSNPVAMNFYQIGAYLTVPAQVSIGVADSIMRGSWEKPGDPVDSFEAAVPTFLQFQKVSKSEGKTDAYYGYSVSFESALITNSTFADTYAEYGLWGWLYAIGLYSVGGYMFGWLARSSTVIAGSAGILGYSFAEVWRAQLLNTGIVIFLLLLTAGCAIASTASIRLKPRRTPI